MSNSVLCPVVVGITCFAAGAALALVFAYEHDRRFQPSITLIGRTSTGWLARHDLGGAKATCVDIEMWPSTANKYSVGDRFRLINPVISPDSKEVVWEVPDLYLPDALVTKIRFTYTMGYFGLRLKEPSAMWW